MSLSAKDLMGYSIRATDGDAGSVEELYFDDEGWKVRYVVAKAGGLLANRRVLVAPEVVDRTDRESQVLHLGLTKEQVENAPSAETERPVADQEEVAHLEDSGAPSYWGSGWEAAGPGPIHPEPHVPHQTDEVGVPREKGDPHLRSTREVEGYRIEATDAGVGHVEDLVVDDEGWEIRYIVVDTRDWLPGKKVLVSPRSISGVSWSQKEVYVDLTQDEVERAPEWTPNGSLDR